VYTTGLDLRARLVLKTEKRLRSGEPVCSWFLEFDLTLYLIVHFWSAVSRIMIAIFDILVFELIGQLEKTQLKYDARISTLLPGLLISLAINGNICRH
jgi:hypothetical protein